MPDNRNRQKLQKKLLVINSTEFWFKITGYLQQNWALVEKKIDDTCEIYFMSDHGEIFDIMLFPNYENARDGLVGNQFVNLQIKSRSGEFFKTIQPKPPYYIVPWLSNFGVYSSGGYWKLGQI